MAFLDSILRVLGGGPMGELPDERQGVRPGFGLEDALIQSSDIQDQLRNADRKEAAVPMGPKGFAGRAVLAKEPAVPAGMKRLYRGGGAGKWWSGSRDVAEDFAQEHALARGQKPVLSALDVLEDTAKKAGQHPRIEKAAIAAEDAYYLPKRYWEIAKLLKLK